jgi:hypothetical protein
MKEMLMGRMPSTFLVLVPTSILSVLPLCTIIRVP